MNFIIPFESLINYPDEEKHLLEMAMFMTEYMYYLVDKQDAIVLIDKNYNVLHYNEGNLPFGVKVGKKLPEGTVTSQALRENAPIKVRKSKEESPFKIPYIGTAMPIKDKNGTPIGAIGHIYSTEKWDIIQETSSIASKSIQSILDSFNFINQSISRATLSTNEAFNQVGETEKKLSKIKEVIYLIKKIADQTNMLSLNASIEAARAGDAGKGFEIVAMEVGKLANSTKHSVTSITNGLNDITGSIKLLAEKLNHIKNDASKQDMVIIKMQEKVSGIITDLEKVEHLTKKIAI